MIFIILFVVALICGLVGWGMAREKGKDPLTWAIICVLFPVIGLAMLALTGADEPRTAAETPELKKWRALADVDDDIAAAGLAARAHGDVYEAKLAEKYFMLNDKQYLGKLLENVVTAAQADKVAIEAAPATPASSGSFGNYQFRVSGDGTHTITRGYPHVGQSFTSYDEMVAACK